MSNSDSFVSIRGRKLPLHDLVDARLYNETYLQTLRERVQTAQPFQHFVEDGWFNPLLLELVLEEFETNNTAKWRSITDKNQSTMRSVADATLGPASQLYFGIANSGWLVRILSFLMDTDELIVDTHLLGGGLHETKPGGRFGIHRDFDRHLRTGLRNEMVMITYLNKDWQPEWNGAIELWDPTASHKVASIEPEFGRTIFMRHGKDSFHGHPHPLTSPEGVIRRSIASYYYSNRFAKIDREARQNSLFLLTNKSDTAKRIGKAITPPIVWDLLARLARL